MSGQRVEVCQDRTIAKLMSEGGMKLLRSSLRAGLKPEVAILSVAQAATRMETYERLEEISAPLIHMPKVRGRLRQAGYTLAVRDEREYAGALV